MPYFTEEEKATREFIGECTAAPDHETLWLHDEGDDPYGYCLHCGAEFLE